MELLENATIGKLGGVFQRPGSQVVNSITALQDIVFIPFVLDNDQVYFIQVYKNFPITIEDGTSGNLYAGIGIVEVNGPSVSNPTLTVKSHPLDTADTPAGADLTTAFPFGKWQYIQFGKVVVVTHSSGLQKPFVLTVDDTTSPPSFFVEYYTSYLDASGHTDSNVTRPMVLRRPYQDSNITATTLTPSATTGVGTTINLTSSVANVLKVGYVYKILQGSNTGAAMVISNTSTTVSSCIVLIAHSATTASDNWQESAWGKYNWPKTLVVHEQRLFWGGSKIHPDFVWGSVLGNIFTMMANKLAQDASTNASGIYYFGAAATTDAFFFRPASTQLNEIRWLSSGRALVIGTAVAEYIAEGSGDSVLSASSIRCKDQTHWGGQYVRPIKSGTDIVYVDVGARNIRNFRYSDENGAYLSGDISAFSEGVIQGSIEGLSWNPTQNVIWAVDSSGRLSAATYSENFVKNAWSAQVMDGVNALTILSIFSSKDYLHLLTKRGSSYYYEKIYLNLSPSNLTSLVDGWYLDFYKLCAVAAATALLGSWYANEVVYAYLDGEVYGPYTASAGGTVTGIDASLNATEPIWGIGYQLKGRTMSIEAGGEYGNSQGDTRRIDTVTARLYKSLAGNIRGDESENSDPLLPEEYAGTLFTGETSNLKLAQSPTRENKVYFESDIGKPLNILNLIFKGQTNVT